MRVPRTMRGMATWLILAAVGLVAVAGLVDALHGSSSRAGSARHNTITVDGLTVTTPSAQITTEHAASTQPVVATPVVATTAPPTQSAAPERLPSCTTDQLRLTFTVEGGRAAAVLRRVQGEPCHHGRVSIWFTVRDQSGHRVAVFEAARATQPVDFSNGFEQLLVIPDLSCDPGGSFLVVARVGAYVARRTLPGAELPCNHG